MSRLVLTAFGDPIDSVQLEPTPELVPGPRDVVIDMEAATLNASDFLLAAGQYAVRPQLPSPVGAEGAGRVRAVGEAVDPALVGRRVIVLPSYEQGTWADAIVTGEHNVLPVADGADPLQLAMVGVNPATAQVLLRRFAALVPGDWVGQTAANSAVGRYVIALAKRRGLRTLNVVRRESAAEEVRQAGGDRVVVGTENVAKPIAEALGGSQLALVLDGTGGPVVPELAHALRFGATVVSYAVASGVPPSVSIPDLVFNEVRLTGFWVINWLRTADRAEIESTYRELAELVESGDLVAPVEATYSLPDYRQAIKHAMTNERSGKILFTFD